LLRADIPVTATATIALSAAIVLCTFFGYLLFVFRYTDASCDTIKACYLLQTAPFLALLAAALLDRFTNSRPRTAIVVAAVLLLMWLHNLPAMLTHYPTPPHFTLAQ
jgi:hypothetical protein